jgi:formylmethanofuran dehydrogenase subunit E
MKTICGHSIEEYIAMIEKFHGHLAPGLLIGGFMVDLAQRNRPDGEFFDYLCETSVCLPDAIQILTPCTYGNGWLKVVPIGRFALAMFEKQGGKGVRVHLDMERLKQYGEIHSWFMKLKPKKEQDKGALIAQILEAGDAILGATAVQVAPGLVGKQKTGPNAICPSCGEAYPAKDGGTCRACAGTVLYA